MKDDSFRLQFGLRTMLIALTVGGVGIGLLGKLFFTNPNIAVGIVGMLTTVVPFVLATGTLCRIGWRSKQTSLWVWGLVLGLTPLVGSGVIIALQSFARPSSGGRGIMSNKELIQRELPKDVTDYNVWEELSHRAETDKLTSQNVDGVVSAFAKYAKRKRPNGWGQPLHGQDDFFKTVRSKKLISNNALIDMSDAFFGPPRIKPYKAGSGRQRVEIEYGTVWANESHHGLGVTHVWEVKDVLVDGEPLELQRESRHYNDWNGSPKDPIPADAIQLTAKLEIAYIVSSKMIGLDADKLPADRWPKAIKRWKQTVKIPLDGSDPFKQPPRPIKLVTDPKKKPPVPKIERLVVQRDANDMRTIVAKFGDVIRPPIPVSFDVFVRIEDDKVPIGTYYVIPFENGNGVSYAGNELISHGHLFESNAEFADLIFEPNIEPLQKALMNSHGEEYDSINEMWGKSLTLPEVELERLDLEIE